MASRNVQTAPDWFAAARAAKLSGLSLAMVNYLCRTNIIEPSGPGGRGHGVKRRYTFGDLVALRLVARLSAAGVSVLRMKRALQGLRKLHPSITLTSLPASHVVTDGKDLFLRQAGESLERLVDGQFTFAFVVELSQLQEEVARGIEQSTAAAKRRTPTRRKANG